MDPHIYMSPEFIETIGIDDFASRRNYGRERGNFQYLNSSLFISFKNGL